MEFRAGVGALWIVRIIVISFATTLSVILCLPWWLFDIGGYAVVWVPWLVAIPLSVIYVPRLVASLHGVLTDDAIHAVYGVFWRREVFVPLHSLRNFEVWTPPLHRVFHCRTVVLRFAGGTVLLPLLAKQDAERLTACLEQIEEML